MAPSVRSLPAAVLACAVLINVLCAAPVRVENDIDWQPDNSKEEFPAQPRPTTKAQAPVRSEDAPSSTTEDPVQVLGRIYNPISDRPGRIAFAGGVHKFRINDDEDEKKRLLEEYNYHFVRVEQNLPPTTRRENRYRPPPMN